MYVCAMPARIYTAFMICRYPLRRQAGGRPARRAAVGHADGARPPLLLELQELMELPSELEPLVLPSRRQAVQDILRRANAEGVLKAHTVEGKPYSIVRAGTQRGELPEILARILAQRKKAKKAMKSAATEHERGLQNARQLALKVSANSVYGFTGAQVGQLPCLEISSTVTACLLYTSPSPRDS